MIFYRYTIITEDIDPTDADKAEQITEYFASLNDIQKTEVYTAILILSRRLNTWSRGKTPIWKIFRRGTPWLNWLPIPNNFDKAAAEGYLSDYSDDELRELLKKQIETLVTEQYAEQAQAQVLQIKGRRFKLK